MTRMMHLLETLPGWPEVADPSAMDILGLTVGIPFAIGGVFALIILGPSWYRKSQAAPSTELAER